MELSEATGWKLLLDVSVELGDERGLRLGSALDDELGLLLGF
jgi:hypothetical protein